MTVQHHYHCQPENSPPRRFQMFYRQMCFLLSKLHFAFGTLWKKSCLFGFTSGVNVGHFFFWQSFVFVLPACRKWGPRTGKMTNCLPALCSRCDQYSPPVLRFHFLASNLRLSNAVCFIYCCSPSTSPSSSSYIPSPVSASHSLSFQLIDTFALEIGELKKEMVQTSATADTEPLDLRG